MPYVTSINLARVLKDNVHHDADLMTDEHRGYIHIGKRFATHPTVTHSHREYVRGSVHTNTVEGFFSQLKRSIDGTPTRCPATTCIAT